MSVFSTQMNELIQLYKIFQIIQVKILVAYKFQIEQELSYSNHFLNNDYELATRRIQVIDQPRTFILLFFYFTKQLKCKLQDVTSYSWNQIQNIRSISLRTYKNTYDFQK
ncbi:Hypothetical_protein [Hexamita inflata]|uniref:Hypothetical_protein n=1 Tax=Hexamita inflata TaxID=28002 RepID=A0AA86PTR0_9EUKA|nr:Hypothetical protein HINF_LOCUS32443 [Hexamita inflata]